MPRWQKLRIEYVCSRQVLKGRMRRVDKDWELLYNEACRLQGEVKVSKFLKIKEVASALMTSNGNIYSGISLANSCAAGMCAERNAIGNMLANGEVEISRIVSVKDNGKIVGRLLKRY